VNANHQDLNHDYEVAKLMKRSSMRQTEIESVLTVSEVAEILRVHSTTIYRLVKRGDLPGFKLGGNWRINRASLDLWLLAVRPQHVTPRT
jgi:excisionase family DNA binding protein